MRREVKLTGVATESKKSRGYVSTALATAPLYQVISPGLFVYTVVGTSKKRKETKKEE